MSHITHPEAVTLLAILRGQDEEAKEAFRDMAIIESIEIRDACRRLADYCNSSIRSGSAA
jgi:hypothetical protein